MKDFNEFISDIRQDRLKEMQAYYDRDIQIPNKYKYIYISRITIMHAEKKIEIGVHVNNNDVYFFHITNGSNAYYTIEEIYNVLHRQCEMGYEDSIIHILSELEKISFVENLSEAQMDSFEYNGESYWLKRTPIFPYDGMIQMEDGGGSISFREMFVLINMIQEKSNALYTRGASLEKNIKYTNGILRLWIALLTAEEDRKELKKIGWKYNKAKRCFEKVIIKDKALTERKYCLTDIELSNILRTES